MTLHERVIFIRDLLTAVLLFVVLVGIALLAGGALHAARPQLSPVDQELCTKTGAPIYCDAVKR